MPKAKKKKAGRPKLPKGQRRRMATTALSADLYRLAQELGEGSVYRGLQVALERAASQPVNGGVQS